MKLEKLLEKRAKFAKITNSIVPLLEMLLQDYVLIKINLESEQDDLSP
jgi:hypothetical protein